MSIPTRTLAAALTFAILAGGVVSARADVAATPDGKKVFLDQKCNMCHAVSSAGIEPTGKIKAPDLAGLASKEDAAWLGKFLRKDADKNGKKHLKAFTGSDEDLKAVIAWLQKQTAPAKK